MRRKKNIFYNGAINHKSSRQSKLVLSRVLSAWDHCLQGLTTDELFYKVILLRLNTVTLRKPTLLSPFGPSSLRLSLGSEHRRTGDMTQELFTCAWYIMAYSHNTRGKS